MSVVKKKPQVRQAAEPKVVKQISAFRMDKCKYQRALCAGAFVQNP